ncbi:MAG: hypothetical protein U1E26_01590 [Coriobacteriia bacterium]|nr:hypothetical protein [Coriobacteriia bacterium]
MSIYSNSVDVLAPLVGKPAAEICMRSTAMKLGKRAEDFSNDDYDTVAGEIKSSLSAFASSALIDGALLEIRTRSGL